MWIFNLSLSFRTVLSPMWASRYILSLAGLFTVSVWMWFGTWYSFYDFFSNRQLDCLSSELQEWIVNCCSLQLENKNPNKTRFFPSNGQPGENFCLARFLAHLSFPSQHVRLQTKALLLLVLLNINASFLPLSIQRDRGLTNTLGPCVIYCLTSEAGSIREVRRLQQGMRDREQNSSVSILHLSRREEFLSKSGIRRLKRS